jgi:lipopolysaccharide/colanic/teichoic acid biosynthesis glycosyltransferase
MNISRYQHSQQNILPAEAGAELFRRLMDIALAGLALLLLWPLLLLIGLAIGLDTPGPLLFRQERLGRDGKVFALLKFRTMRLRAETKLAALLEGDPTCQQHWEQFQKLQDDPRLTGVGIFLRRFSLDELPQIINVLRGEMSLVGPRPILPEQRDLYGPAFDAYSLVRPGITGLWQVSGRNLTTFAERVRWDQTYLERRSLALDAAILRRTFVVVLKGEGAY